MTEEELVSLVRFLEETPRVVRQFSENLSETELRWKPSEDEFSVLENVCHLRDIEREGYSVRIEKLLNEDKPFLHDLDGARMALARDYNNQDFSTALEDFSQAREVNARKLVELSVEQLNRSGEFEGVGEITLEKLLQMMREHDDGHRQELKSRCQKISLESD
ncbi:MAG: hypothetical protein AUG51_13380 [Acidobacteria bacterium 13_1_20CM_3_53_8]|nr:MAG: hypothetical protein AUG51_13380 [Acidobacteria bacterium 13_1_20CM_3_53_8]